MARRFVLALLVAFIPLTGCTTCDNPYDECGPVIDANFHPAGFRSGSTLAAPMSTPTVAPESIPTPPAQPTDPSIDGDPEPDMSPPPEMEKLDSTSVMRPRLRYAR